MTKTAVALGDSQTDLTAVYGVGARDTWSQRLSDLLGGWQTRAFGVSGDTTTMGLARADAIFMHEAKPDLFLLALGVNDPSASIATATTRQNLSAALMAAKHGAKGRRAGMGAGVTAATPSALPDAQSARAGQRMVVLSDDSTTGGAPALRGQATTITGTVAADANGNKVTVWECRYPLAGEFGWGRVATHSTTPTAILRCVVVPPPYRNYTTGGDTLTTPYAANATLRAAMLDVVATENVTVAGAPSVIYSDLYAFLKGRIQAGTDPDFSAVAYDQARSWHNVQNDQHFTAYGHMLLASKLDTDIRATWPSLVG